MTTMPDQPPVHDLAELERLLKEATPGPWKWTEDYGGQFESSASGRCVLASQLVRGHDGGDYNSALQVFDNAEANVDLIAAAVNALPDLLEAVKAAREFIASMAFRHSSIYGRSVPSGFTAASSDAAVDLGAALRPFYGSGGAILDAPPGSSEWNTARKNLRALLDRKGET